MNGFPAKVCHFLGGFVHYIMKKTLFYIPFLLILLLPVFVHADTITYPDGCTATTKFSATTGQPCQKPACAPGDVYSSETGQKCSDINTSLPQGCITLNGYSPLTGIKCDGTTLNIQTVSQANGPVVDNSTLPDTSGTPTIKLVTKDLGNSYEFDAYLFDKDGNNFNLAQNNFNNNAWKYSTVQFSTKGSVFNNDRWSNANFEPVSGYMFYPATQLKQFVGPTITVSFPDNNMTKTFNVSDSIQG